MNKRTYLFGSHDGSATEMQSGTYRYTFDCLLPKTIPETFTGSCGRIRYYVEAYLDIPRFAKDHRVYFTVVRKDNPNENPELTMPCKQEEIVKFCFFFCQFEPLLMTATIPFSAYTPGQIIPVTVCYDNKSNVRVDRTKVNLARFIQFQS